MLSVRTSWAVFAAAAMLTAVGRLPGAVEPGPNLNRESYSLDFWHGEQGLPQSRVRAVVQTRDGYLWLGTDGGLMRFDGMNFTSFTVSTGSLRDNEVWALKEDSSGALWIGTTAGLSRLEKGRFTSFTMADGLPDEWIRQIDEGPAGQLWFATSRGVCRRMNGAFTTFTTKDGLAGDFVTEVCTTTSGGVYAIAAYQLHRLVDGRFVVEANVAAPRDGWLTNISKARDGSSLWLAFERGAIKRLHEGKLITYAPPSDPRARGGRVVEDAQGNVWLGQRSGLSRLREGQFVRSFSSETNARLGAVLSMATDREGNLWLGLEADGLARVRPTQFASLTTDDGLPDNGTRTVFQDSRGNIWIGTINSLACWSREGITTYRDVNGVPIGTVSSIGEDSDGVVWIGSAGELLKVRQGQITKDTTWKRTLGVTAIYRDPRGRMWVGTDGEGLFLCEGERRTVFRAAEGLASDRVRAILTDRDGALWIATFGGGISRYADGKLASFTTKDGLGNDRVVAVVQDKSGAVWFATRGGLTRYHNGRFINLRAADGLPADFLFCILDDGRGSFWFTCSQGIFRVSQTELGEVADGRRQGVTTVVYGVKSGLRTTAFNAGIYPNACRTAAGVLVFCSPKGLVLADPGRVTTNEIAPPVYVERVQINHRGLPVDQPAVVSLGAGEVEIHYSVLGFVAPDRIRVRYRLDGLESEWQEAGARRFAHFASLPAGDYQFRVIACNENERWNEVGATFAFTLLPPFYKRAWFRFVCLLTVVGLIGLAHQWRMSRIKASERELKRRVEEEMAKVKVLHGLLPICASCKKVRDDKGYWNQIEEYLITHSDTKVSHGICPDCVRKLYPTMADEILREASSTGGGQPGAKSQ